MNDLAKAREKVEALANMRSCVNKADVLAILGEEKFTRDDTWPELPLTGGGSYESPNTRKGQRRVREQRIYDWRTRCGGQDKVEFGRRLGKERRHE